MSTRHIRACPYPWVLRLILLGVIFVCPTSGWSKIIRYVDANGVIVFTNIPGPPGEPGSNRTTVGLKKRDRVTQVRTHAYRGEVEQIARQYALNPNLVSALMAVESDFNPEALSAKGAQGLMQLMPLIARHYRVYNPSDPQQNIEGGIRYLNDLLRLFDDRLPLALAAYNGGEGLVRQHGGVPPFLQSYVDKVLTLYERARGTSIHRYFLPSGTILFSNVPLSREQQGRWETNK